MERSISESLLELREEALEDLREKRLSLNSRFGHLLAARGFSSDWNSASRDAVAIASREMVGTTSLDRDTTPKHRPLSPSIRLGYQSSEEKPEKIRPVFSPTFDEHDPMTKAVNVELMKREDVELVSEGRALLDDYNKLRPLIQPQKSNIATQKNPSSQHSSLTPPSLEDLERDARIALDKAAVSIVALRHNEYACLASPSLIASTENVARQEVMENKTGIIVSRLLENVGGVKKPILPLSSRLEGTKKYESSFIEVRRQRNYADSVGQTTYDYDGSPDPGHQHTSRLSTIHHDIMGEAKIFGAPEPIDPKTTFSPEHIISSRQEKSRQLHIETIQRDLLNPQSKEVSRAPQNLENTKENTRSLPRPNQPLSPTHPQPSITHARIPGSLAPSL